MAGLYHFHVIRRSRTAGAAVNSPYVHAGGEQISLLSQRMKRAPNCAGHGGRLLVDTLPRQRIAGLSRNTLIRSIVRGIAGETCMKHESIRKGIT